jgi:hypothetical protein
MNERQEMLEHLSERIGFTPEEARAAMQDDDLWINPPNCVWTSRVRRP